jgi:hypothetical protein
MLLLLLLMLLLPLRLLLLLLLMSDFAGGTCVFVAVAVVDTSGQVTDSGGQS